MSRLKTLNGERSNQYLTRMIECDAPLTTHVEDGSASISLNFDQTSLELVDGKLAVLDTPYLNPLHQNENDEVGLLIDDESLLFIDNSGKLSNRNPTVNSPLFMNDNG
ncbi:hypothetical protein DFS34DRAFT_683413 [Phlyctochytrium arcticum]|nr:hypothetical protein DFS34DRAFT_683413 [Phlyctochytrium arcticum]